MAGIEALAYAFPRYSVKAEAYVGTWGFFAGRGIREKTVAGYDEDELTLALAAASRLPADEVGCVAAASTSGPRMSTTLVTALHLPAARKADFVGSSNASGEALLSCLDYVESRGRPALLAAAHRARGSPGEASEHPLGAAGVALLLSPDGGLEARETATQTHEALGDDVTDPAGRRRSLGVGDSSAKAVAGAVREVLSPDEGEIWVACHEPDGRFARRALAGAVDASRIGGNVVELAGDTGCASPLLALGELLAGRREGDDLLLVTAGGGSSVALRLRLRRRLALPPSPRSALAGDRVYLDYLRYARFQRFLADPRPPGEVSMGAYLSLPSYLETVGARYRLEAARCAACGHLHFPPRPVCLGCGGRAFETEALSGRGVVYARTVIGRGSAPTEFREQQDLVGEYAVCLVELEEGPRVVAQITDADPEEVQVGTPLEMVVRRLYRQEGVVRYGYKFRPRRE